MFEQFHYHRRVAFCDTDAMKVVHHSNYLRYFEEARVAWLRARELSQWHAPHYPMTMAVLESRLRHHRPAYFDDLLTVSLTVRREKLKIRFRYVISSERFIGQAICEGETLHIPVDDEFRVCRLPEGLIRVLEVEPWIET